MSNQRTFTQDEVNRIVQDRLNEEKQKHAKALDQANTSPDSARRIEQLEKSLEALQQQADQRATADKADQLEKTYLDRFNAITGDKKWVNDYARQGVFADWRKAVESGDHKDKGDLDIFTAVTKDTKGLYQGVQQQVLHGGDNNYTGGADSAVDPLIRNAMGLNS